MLKEGSVAAHNVEIYILHVPVISNLRKNTELIDVLTGIKLLTSLVSTDAVIKNGSVAVHSVEIYIH